MSAPRIVRMAREGRGEEVLRGTERERRLMLVRRVM
jgi:hypothetical protein